MKDQNSKLAVLSKSLIMKNFLIILSFLLTTGALSAQVNIGLRFNSPSVSNNEASKEFFVKEVGSVYNLNYLSTRTSYAYGLGFYKEIGSAYIGADILYREKTEQFKVDEIRVNTRNARIHEDKFKEVSIPIVAGWRKNNFKIGAGPVFTLIADRNFSLKSLEGFTTDEKKVDTGFQFQVGYIIKDRIHIDLKRELNFNQPGDDYKIFGNQVKLKSLPHTASLSVGVYF